MAGKVLMDLLNGYERDPKYKNKSKDTKRFFSRSYSGSVTGKVNSVMSKTSRLGNGITLLASYTTSLAYGAGFLCYGLINILLYFIADYFSLNTDNMSYSVIIGIVFSLISIPLLFSDKPIGQMLQGNRVLDFVFFEFFCIKRPHFADMDSARGIPLPVACILGTLLASASLLIPSVYVGLAILSAIVIYVTLLSPECSLLISLMALPYLGFVPYSEVVFAVLTVLTFLSFARKVVCGKRVYSFEQYDFFIFLILISVLISGIFVKGMESFTSSLIMFAMSMGYTLAGNLITNRRIADCALNAVTISSIPAAAYSVFIFVSALSAGELKGLIGKGISSTFASTDTYAIYLLVAIICSAALVKQASGGTRVLYFAVFLLNFVALIMTGEAFAIASLFCSLIAYPILKGRGMWTPLVAVTVMLPYLVITAPEEYVNRVLEFVPSITRLESLRSLWGASLRAFSENMLLGIGMGEDSFVTEMANYGIHGFADSKNLFIELGLEAGVFALAFFIILLFVRIRHRIVYNSYVRHSEISSLAPFVSCMNVALIAYGATEYIWTDGPSIYLFCVVFGIGSAMLRMAKKEVDDRTLYYEDTRDVDYSAIDIEID